MVVLTGQVPTGLIGTDAFQRDRHSGDDAGDREAQLSDLRRQHSRDHGGGLPVGSLRASRARMD